MHARTPRRARESPTMDDFTRVRSLSRACASSRCETTKIRAGDPVRRGSDDGWRTVRQRLRGRDVATCSSAALRRVAVAYDGVRVKGSVNSTDTGKVRNYRMNDKANASEAQVNLGANKRKRKKK